MKSETIQT